MTDQPTLRRCIGSARFGIEAHEAPIDEFPAQASQKDGLGRMCRQHWNQYTAGLARDAKARNAAEAAAPVADAEPEATPAGEAPTAKRSPAVTQAADEATRAAG